MYRRILFILVCVLSVITFTGSQCASKLHESDSKEKKIEIPAPLKNVSEQILERQGYTLSYNKDYKIPNWVAWCLTSDHVDGDVKRPNNAWHEDMDVPTPRANNSDFRRSGWTRGHMCPAGDNKWSEAAMYESFLLSNACPQDASLNSGEWNQIELSCRRWAKKYGTLYIVAGPILYRQEHITIGENQVVVPEAFFKVVMCLNGTPKGIGFIRKNTDGSKQRDMYVNSISEVERISGIHFFPSLSKEVAEQVKKNANINEW